MRTWAAACLRSASHVRARASAAGTGQWGYRKLAGIYLGKRENDIAQLIYDGELQEIKNGEPEAS